MGYEGMDEEDVVGILLFNRAIALDYQEYLDQCANNGHFPPPVAAFRPFAAGSRIGDRPDTTRGATNNIFIC